MSRAAKAWAEYQKQAGDRVAGLEHERHEAERELQTIYQAVETEKQAATDEHNKSTGLSAQLPQLQQALAQAEAEKEEISQAAALAVTETQILENTEQQIFGKLKDASAFLQQAQTEAEQLLVNVKEVSGKTALIKAPAGHCWPQWTWFVVCYLEAQSSSSSSSSYYTCALQAIERAGTSQLSNGIELGPSTWLSLCTPPEVTHV